MMRKLPRWMAAILLMCLAPANAQNGVTITTEGNTRRVSTPAYEAVVSGSGAVSSLKLNGQEYLRIRGASRGAYFHQGGSVDLTQIEQAEPGVLIASGDKARARYEFKPDALTWSLTNTTEKYMNFFMVFDPAVIVGRGENGQWAKPPVNAPWKKSTWFAGKSKLDISGATRVWGPWNDLNQVWEATLAPNETRIIELRPGVPDAMETVKVNELNGAANAPAAATGMTATTPVQTITPAQATVPTALTLPSFFSDNMVLQREMQNPFWGWAAPGEAITVTIGRQSKSTLADTSGKWMVKLDALPVGGPYEITVKGKTTRTLKNVLSGDVWICSGQSNMAYTMKETIDGTEAAQTANDSQLRLFKANLKASETPLTDVSGRWTETTPATAGYFSAVGYFFGKKLRDELNVPIGLISTAWGGTQIESWLSPESFKADPDYEFIAAREAKAVAEKGESRAKNNMPSALYFGMNVPMAPLAIKGVAWYQGEANIGRAFQYRRLFPLVINDWRKLWARPDLPFVWVQLPGIGKVPEQPGGSGQAELREAQAMALSLPNTAMAVTLELGDPNDIHPKYKKEVGNRLALATLQKIYKRDVVGSGPVYSGMKIEGNTIRLSFKEVGGGLVAKDGEPLKGFAIAGADQKWVWADAKIDGDTVVVSNANVSTPVAVRYAWSDTPPFVTLYNKAGLPAAPFRTDDWPGWTVPNK